MNLLGYLFDPTHWQGPSGVGVRLLEHLQYTLTSLIIAAVLAIPIGVLIGHTGRGSGLVIGFSNAMRAIPTLGLVVVAVLLTSTGIAPVIFVLVVLALPPILTATAAGVSGADREAVYSARALGMTGGQIVGKVEWPLALPLVISGLRSASLQVVATATVAAYVTVGGLGRLVIDGVRNGDPGQSIGGAILVAVLAIVFDVTLGGIGWAAGRNTRPRSVRRSRAATPAAR